MDCKTKATRKFLNDIPEKQIYLDLMERAKLTPTERIVCDMKYLEGQNLCFIGDTLGFSEDWTKRIHHSALKKLSQIIDN